MNQEVLKTFEKLTDDEVTQRLETSHERFKEMKAAGKRGIEQRLEKIEGMARYMEKERENIALLLSHEVGKPLPEGRGEIDKCVQFCRYYVKNAMRYVEDEQIDQNKFPTCFARYEPIGTVLGNLLFWSDPFQELCHGTIHTGFQLRYWYLPLSLATQSY